MKCSVCQAILLPVDGEMFCLQCGRAEHEAYAKDAVVPKSEDATDPILKRALMDATDGDIVFTKVEAPVPVEQSQPVKHPGHSFLSLRSWLAPPRPMATNGALVMSPPPQMPAAAEADPVPVVKVAAPAVAVPVLAPAPVAVTVPDLAASARTAVSVMPAASLGERVIEKGMVKAWVIGLVGLGLFVGINLAISSYYSNRVYPGVHVGNLAVGGWTFDEVHQKLPQALPKPALAAVIGAGHYDLELDGSGAGYSADLERNVRESGRSTALPLAGLVGSWFEKPVSPTFTLGDDVVDRSVQRLAAEVERTPSNAVAMIHGTDVLVLADKPGVRLDKPAAAAAIRAAYGHVANVSINPVRLEPSVGAADYANDVTAAQATITTVVQITVKKAHYSPTPGQIAGWVVFNGPGKGVTVNAAGVAVFVATIPGSFDRSGTVTGVVAALNARQGAALSPSTKKPTGNPTPASTAAVGSAASYNYCLDETAGAAPELVTATGKVLGPGGSWTLGGKLSFVQVQSGCNFTVRLAGTSALAALDPTCEHQTTCRIHNDLAIASASWAKLPLGWVGDIGTYRAELINHVVGQWLGFEHPSCSVAATQVPVLSTPSLVIGGCSPKWYPVPAELQDTKVLPGF